MRRQLCLVSSITSRATRHEGREISDGKSDRHTSRVEYEHDKEIPSSIREKESQSSIRKTKGDGDRLPHDTGQEPECTGSLCNAIEHAKRSDSELDVCLLRIARKAQLRRIELGGQRAESSHRDARSQKVISRKVKRQTKTTFLDEKGTSQSTSSRFRRRITHVRRDAMV